MFVNFKNTGMILKVRKSVIFSYVGSYVYKEIVHNFRYFTLFKYDLLFSDNIIPPDPVLLLNVKKGFTELQKFHLFCVVLSNK